MEHARSRAALDRIGAVLSMACALHCLLTPVLVASVSLGALSWPAGEGTEVTLLSAAATLAAVALGWGWHAHRRLESLGLFGVALILVGAGRFLVPEAAETPMVVAGGLSIALAHVVNARLCRSCAGCRAAAGAEPPRPYPHDALEPYIDARTMEIHHGKHHQAYVANPNQRSRTGCQR